MTANILVVDDLERNVKLLEAKLKSEYYNVFSAQSGPEALESLKNNKIDVVLLDVMMPGMDGFETCKNIKSNPETKYIPVLMVTALSDPDNRIKGLEAGADEFLTKPLNDSALFARVKSLTRMKSVIDELKLRNDTNKRLGESSVEFREDVSDSKIAIINDDSGQAENIERILSKLTKDIKITPTFSELQNIKGYSPDLIILSSHLEKEDPLRVSAVARSDENFKKSSLMLSIEEENIHIVIKAMELGINDYFIYPVDEAELSARIRTQLRRKKYMDDLRSALEDSVNLSLKDGLTGLFNRRYFDAHIRQLVKKSEEENKPLRLLMCDIDHFKQVNDAHGHQAGDAILKNFSEILKNNFRITDLIARYGGEEFCILLYDVNSADAMNLAERTRKSVESTRFPIPGAKTIDKTVSIGIAEYQKGETVESFIERADKALYEVKNGGRNMVKAL